MLHLTRHDGSILVPSISRDLGQNGRQIRNIMRVCVCLAVAMKIHLVAIVTVALISATSSTHAETRSSTDCAAVIESGDLGIVPLVCATAEVDLRAAQTCIAYQCTWQTQHAFAAYLGPEVTAAGGTGTATYTFRGSNSYTTTAYEEQGTCAILGNSPVECHDQISRTFTSFYAAISTSGIAKAFVGSNQVGSASPYANVWSDATAASIDESLTNPGDFVADAALAIASNLQQCHSLDHPTIPQGRYYCQIV